MQPFKNITFVDVFDGHNVRIQYIEPIKTLVEANSNTSSFRTFDEYYDGAEGIRYTFDVGFADLLMPKQNQQEIIRIPHLFLRSKLFTMLREMRLD
jgi:hypothetical protein